MNFIVCCSADDRETLKQYLTLADEVCVKCSAALLIDSKNVPLIKRDSLLPICKKCYLSMENGEAAFGAVVSGRYVPVLNGLCEMEKMMRPRRQHG